MQRARVLLVDDDPLYVRRASRILGCHVDLQVAASRCAALDATADWQPDVIVLDMLLGDADAFRLIDELRARYRDAAPGVVYLAKGPGSIQRLQGDAGSFLGVVKRDAGIDALLVAILAALCSLRGVIQPAA
jgi:CheY-like chemotaxis protein